MPEDLCLTMEYLPLGSLNSDSVPKPMRELDVRLIVRQILQGLEHMRAHGFVHRDLKPDVSEPRPTMHWSSTLTISCLKNILVQQWGPSWWVKIADFGISKRVKAPSDVPDTRVCTGGFEAPEQRGIFHVACSHATDIFATGCVAYLLLSNILAFEDDNGESLARFCHLDNIKHEIEHLCRPLKKEKVSLDGINFIFLLLTPDPTKRPEARNCLDHSWAMLVSPTPADSVISQETPDTTDLAVLSTFTLLGQGAAEHNEKLTEQETKGYWPSGPEPVRTPSDATIASGSWSVKFKNADALQPMTAVGEELQVETLAQSSRRQTWSQSEHISVVPHHFLASPPRTHSASSHPSQPYGMGLANQSRTVSMPPQTPNTCGPRTTHPPQHRDSGYESPASLHTSPMPTENHDASTGAAAEMPAFETAPDTQRENSMADIMSGSPIDRFQGHPATYMSNPQAGYTASPRQSIDGLPADCLPQAAPRVQRMQDTPSPRQSLDGLSPNSLPQTARRVRSRVSFSPDTYPSNTDLGANTNNRHSHCTPSPRASSDSLIPNSPPRTAHHVRSMASIRSESRAIQWEKQTEVGFSKRCVVTLTLSDNGQSGASWCQEGILRIWDPRNKQQRGQSEIKDVTSLLFSPGSTILAVRTKRALKLYTMEKHPFQLLRRVEIDGNHTVEQPFASGCLFSKDGQRIAVPSAGTGRIWLVNTTNGSVFGQLNTSGASITSIAISPYLDTLAVALSDNTVRTWNLQDYCERMTLRHNAGPPARVTRVAYSTKGLVAASSTSGILKIWDADGCTVETEPQDCRLLDCAFCPGSDLVVTADDGGVIRFFNSTTAELDTSRDVQHDEHGPVLRVFFSPDGTFGVSCGYRTLEVWRTATAEVLYRSLPQFNDGCEIKACFGQSPESLDILAVAFEGGVQLLDLGTLRNRTSV